MKCKGCGVTLQSDNKELLGYTNNINNDLCERCFRIRNYSDYKLVSKSNDDYLSILSNIGKTNSLVVLVIDLFNIPKSLDDINKYINNKILLVLSKRDILPLSVYDNNLMNYFDNFDLNIVDKVIISSNKNIHFDDLISKIRKYQTDENVYIIGYTNAGKSTMINKIIYNYTDMDTSITTSMLPSTTIDTLNISIDDSLTLIDTPGLLNNNIIDYVDINLMKKIVPKREIKPRTYQIKSEQSLIIDNILEVYTKDYNSLTFYISNDLEIDRKYKFIKLDNLKEHKLKVLDNFDIVIPGLGFIKCVKESNIVIYTLDNVDVYIREALI